MSAQDPLPGRRCAWVGDDPLYADYHDREWGVPQGNARALYEKLVLEGFQAGLSWITILRKREGFRAAFDGFEPEAVARYGPEKIETLMGDAGIVRNRAKIEASIANARAFLDFEAKRSFAAYLWDFVDGTPVQNSHRSLDDVPAQTQTSTRMAKALKQAGFRFCGPTTVYAFMQSVGMVNDHLVDCPRYADCAELGRGFQLPDGAR